MKNSCLFLFFYIFEDLHMLDREVEAVLPFHRKLHGLMNGPKELGIPHPGQGITVCVYQNLFLSSLSS